MNKTTLYNSTPKKCSGFSEHYNLINKFNEILYRINFSSKILQNGSKSALFRFCVCTKTTFLGRALELVSNAYPQEQK